MRQFVIVQSSLCVCSADWLTDAGSIARVTFILYRSHVRDAITTLQLYNVHINR